jgi:hypothetical protein
MDNLAIGIKSGNITSPPVFSLPLTACFYCGMGQYAHTNMSNKVQLIMYVHRYRKIILALEDTISKRTQQNNFDN